MEKAEFNKSKVLFTKKLKLNSRKKPVICKNFDTTLHGAENCKIWEGGSEVPEKFLNVILEKDGQKQAD